MDGNDSLKRVLRRGTTTDGGPGLVVECPDDRIPDTDYYISRMDVDKWAESSTKDRPELKV